MLKQIDHEIGTQQAVFQTISAYREGGVLFAEIAAPPMNLLGPELVRDLVSLIQQTEADDSIYVLVFKSADPDYFISHVDVTRIAGFGEWAKQLTGEPSIAMLFRYLSASRLVTIAQIEGRVRGVGSEVVLACDMRFAALESAIFGQPEVGFGPPHRPGPGARCAVERRGLRRGDGGALRLDQSRVARRQAWRFRQIAGSPDTQLSSLWRCRNQGAGQCGRARAGGRLSPRFKSVPRMCAQA